MQSEQKERTIQRMEFALRKFQCALADDRKTTYCLRLWSDFIRLRDGYRCVRCRGREGLAAHHIVRKSFLPHARFLTGNGITLCRRCHKEAHLSFNGIADLDQPMDAQGGEKIELITELFGCLLFDAERREILRDDFYYLDDIVLQTFKRAQSIEPTLEFPGCPLRQA